MSQETAQIVAKAFESTVKKDIPTLLSLLAPDCVWSTTYPAHLPFSGEARGPEACLALLGRMGEPFEALSSEVKSLMAQGDQALIFIDEKLRAKATGKVVDNKVVFHVTVKDGKIAHAISMGDTYAVSEALRPD